MSDVTIRDYIGYEKELTAVQVRSLIEGSKITIHHFDRRGEHCRLETTVKSHKNKNGRVVKELAYSDYDGIGWKPIRKETDRMCYTRGWAE